MKLKLVRKTRSVESTHGLCRGDTVLVGERRGKVAFTDHDTNQLVVKMQCGRRELLLVAMPVEVETVLTKRFSSVNPGEYFTLSTFAGNKYLKIKHNIFFVDVGPDGQVFGMSLANNVPQGDEDVYILQPDYEEELIDAEVPF